MKALRFYAIVCALAAVAVAGCKKDEPASLNLLTSNISVEAAGGTWKYDKHCLRLTPEEVEAKKAAGIPWTIRMNAPTEGETSYSDVVFGDMTFRNAESMDDMVLIKQDGMPTYNFANVIDDHLMGITHVMRGMACIPLSGISSWSAFVAPAVSARQR